MACGNYASNYGDCYPRYPACYPTYAPCYPTYAPCTPCPSPCPPLVGGTTFAASSTSVQTVAANTPLVVQFPSVKIPSAYYNSSDGTFTNPVAGNYIYNTLINWTAAEAGTATLSIYNTSNRGTVVGATSSVTVPAAGAYVISIPYFLMKHDAAGDSVYVQFSCTSPATVDAGSKFAGFKAS